jgi:hypothetical protein
VDNLGGTMVKASERPAAPGGRAGSGHRALLGRDDLLGQLGVALTAAIGGHGQVVLLAGEAGIGKTALAALAARVAADAADRGARVLWASCAQDEGTPGYWPWVQVVRQLAAAGGGDHARRLAADAPALSRLVPQLAGRAGAPATSPVPARPTCGPRSSPGAGRTPTGWAAPPSACTPSAAAAGRPTPANSSPCWRRRVPPSATRTRRYAPGCSPASPGS